MDWVQYSLDGAVLDEKYVNKTQDSLQLNYPCVSTSSCYPYIVTLIPGIYSLQLYGVAGGDGVGGVGGKGGYSTGFIEVTFPTTFYVYVGGKGASKTGSYQSIVEGGFNGGGNGVVGGYLLLVGGGGGATDIRNGSKQLKDRIIVAGGGGGGSTYDRNSISEYGGDGGGMEGKTGGADSSRYPGSGGTQASVGTNSNCPTCSGNSNVGGKGCEGGASSAGGGGGGYYGGAGGKFTGGGGGSGYIGGVTSKFVERYTNYSTNENNGYVIIKILIPMRTENCKALISCPRKYPFDFNFSYLLIVVLTK